MDQIWLFLENHTADICLLLLGVFSAICNFIIIYFRTKTSRLEKIVDRCLRPHLDDKSVLNNYYVVVENKKYKLADLELLKVDESTSSTLSEARAIVDTSASKPVR